VEVPVTIVGTSPTQITRPCNPTKNINTNTNRKLMNSATAQRFTFFAPFFVRFIILVDLLVRFLFFATFVVHDVSEYIFGPLRLLSLTNIWLSSFNSLMTCVCSACTFPDLHISHGCKKISSHRVPSSLVAP
jgi:hypothetical protein